MTMGSIIAAAGSKAGRPSGTIPYWNQLRDDVNVIVPISCWPYHLDYLALITGRIAGWLDAWILGAAAHNGAQSNPSYRALAGATDAEFTQANIEHMVLDFSTPEIAGDFTWLMGINLVGSPPRNATMLGIQTGKLRVGGDWDSYYFDDGTKQDTGVTVINTATYMTLMHKAGVASSSFRKNGALMGAKKNATARAIGGICRMGCPETSYSDSLPGDVRFIALFRNTNDTDTGIIEAIAATELGL